jgi:hypothetical protein
VSDFEHSSLEISCSIRSIIAHHQASTVTESAVLPPDLGTSIMAQFRQVFCSKCQSEMVLGRVQEGPSGYDLRTFDCPRCSHQLKTAVKLGDPLQSKATMKWLEGQLIAPE